MLSDCGFFAGLYCLLRLDRLSENLKDGAEQLSNALITPYQSFEGSRTSDNDFFGPPMTLL